MLPNVTDDLQSDFEFAELPTRTFKLNADTNTVTGFAAGLEAVKQAIYLILHTERYEYLVYSWNYGIELQDLFGEPISFVLPELKRRITEALTQDSRITGVDDFNFETSKNKVRTTFTVQTIYGEIESESEVTI